jgi:hypothetical protein
VSKEFASQLRAEAEAHIKGDVTTKWDSSNQILGKIGALATGASVEGAVTVGGSAVMAGGVVGTSKGTDGQESTHTMSAKDAERFMNNLTTSFGEAHKFNASNADLFSKGVGGTSGNSFRELQSAQQSYAQSVNQLTSAVNTHSLVSNVQQSVGGDRLNQYLQISGTRPDGTFSEGRAYEALAGLNRLVNEGRFDEIQTRVNNAIGEASQFGESSASYNSTVADIGAPSNSGFSAPINNLGFSDAQQQALQNHLDNKAKLEGAFGAQKNSLQVSNGVQQVKDQTANTSNIVSNADRTREEQTEILVSQNTAQRSVGAIPGLGHFGTNPVPPSGSPIVPKP